MKPSGRRRFRKMNARFRQRGSDVVRERARETSAGRARKLIFVEFWGRDPVVMPPRPFSPRSLVGATQGARKRAARRCPGCIECKNEIPQRDYGLRCNGGGVFARSPEQWRRRFGIGQRLRPCPGCESCLGRECIGCEGGQLFEGDVCERCRRTATGERICDGSGVLPAKRHRRCGWWLQTRTAKNATLRCGMQLPSGGWLDCQHCGGSGWLMGRGE